MESPIGAFLISLSAVTLAEMGDKTQLLALTFASCYKPAKVMLGVFIATILNHAVAVLVGSILAREAAISAAIQGLAALSFLVFALWTLRGDKSGGKPEQNPRRGEVVTVAVAFFIAELGDKTQLTTMALAAKYAVSPLYILAGSTAGMLIADGLAILIGAVLHKRIPERAVRMVSAAVFALFGLYGCWEAATGPLGLSQAVSAALIAGLAVLTGLGAWLILRAARKTMTEQGS